MQTSSKPTVVVRDVSKTFVVYPDGSHLGLFNRKKRKNVKALQNVSLVANESESIGIIGQNGSGKSTLLNIIAGKESASQGEVLVREQPTILGVNAAMRPSLTGWKNISLGLLAKGLTRDEAEYLRPEVAEWSEIGDAVYRPMSTYSAGMRARLTFSISTAVKSKVLLVDEALATGDATFNEKAAKRMNSFLRDSGSVFVVSHSPSEITSHCSRAIWLHRGVVVSDGDVELVTTNYRRWGNYLASDQPDRAERVLRECLREYNAPKIILDSEAITLLDSTNTISP